MKLLAVNKDGGPESNALAYWLIENKRWFSIGLIKFTGKSRDAYHSHAFDSISWLFKGKLYEKFFDVSTPSNTYLPSIKPIFTSKETFHKVSSEGVSWILTIRGRWSPTWKENTKRDGTYKLKNGRLKV